MKLLSLSLRLEVSPNIYTLSMYLTYLFCSSFLKQRIWVLWSENDHHQNLPSNWKIRLRLMGLICICVNDKWENFKLHPQITSIDNYSVNISLILLLCTAYWLKRYISKYEPWQLFQHHSVRMVETLDPIRWEPDI